VDEAAIVAAWEWKRKKGKGKIAGEGSPVYEPRAFIHPRADETAANVVLAPTWRSAPVTAETRTKMAMYSGGRKTWVRAVSGKGGTQHLNPEGVLKTSVTNFQAPLSRNEATDHTDFQPKPRRPSNIPRRYRERCRQGISGKRDALQRNEIDLRHLKNSRVGGFFGDRGKPRHAMVEGLRLLLAHF